MLRLSGRQPIPLNVIRGAGKAFQVPTRVDLENRIFPGRLRLHDPRSGVQVQGFDSRGQRRRLFTEPFRGVFRRVFRAVRERG